MVVWPNDNRSEPRALAGGKPVICTPMPECETFPDVHIVRSADEFGTLAQAAIYMATAPKSNAIYKAYNAAAADAHTQAAEPVPLHLRNAPTKLMKQLDYGKGYQYAHDEQDAVNALANHWVRVGVNGDSTVAILA